MNSCGRWFVLFGTFSNRQRYFQYNFDIFPKLKEYHQQKWPIWVFRALKFHRILLNSSALFRVALGFLLLLLDISDDTGFSFLALSFYLESTGPFCLEEEALGQFYDEHNNTSGHVWFIRWFFFKKRRMHAWNTKRSLFVKLFYGWM